MATLNKSYLQKLDEASNIELVGGKAVNLGALLRADFPVPGGFVITTDAYRDGYRLADTGKLLPRELKEQIRDAYREMGSSTVAVRSSATAEDMPDASMAGQYETYLNISTEEALYDAVQKCWASLRSERTCSYFKEHGIEASKVTMAVIVQKQIAADVAGVLFTANPHTGGRNEMLIEASWGLGEMVVSGRVQPDVIRCDGKSGEVLEAHIANKLRWLPAGGTNEKDVTEDKRLQPCMKPKNLSDLCLLGRKAQEAFGFPQDIEWAIEDEKLFLLQSRAITALDEAEEFTNLLSDTKQALRDKKLAGHGPWVRHNLAETIPHATPFTWSIIKRFMSGNGGFGALYKQIGFEPSNDVNEKGFLENIAGHIYLDLSRAPDLFFEDFPYKYDLEQLKKDPDTAQNPPTIPNGKMRKRVAVERKMNKVAKNIENLASGLDKKLLEDTIPSFIHWTKKEKNKNISNLGTEAWFELWEEREQKVLDEFAPQSLLPSLVGGQACQELRTFLEENFPEREPDALVQLLSVSETPDTTVKASVDLYKVARGEQSVDEWLKKNGHRAVAEFDLATPRWCERPDELKALANQLKTGQDPKKLHHKRFEDALELRKELRGKLYGREQTRFDKLLDQLQRYLHFREDGKNFLLQGYTLLRDLALDAGRRLDIGDDIFLLTISEVKEALRSGYAPVAILKKRKALRHVETRLSLPYFIDPDAIDELGETPQVDGSDKLSAFPVSIGSASGPARIVHSPEKAGDLGKDYILVCPSTDPAWTPLFVNAAGLVLEKGGTLSHGAVVAREMGLPAVVLDGATKVFSEGETITVDGHGGAVLRTSQAKIKASAEGAGQAESDPEDTHIPRKLIPPIPPAKEKLANKVGLGFGIGWLLYLALCYVLPTSMLLEPTTISIDWLFWDLIPFFGQHFGDASYAWTVGFISVLFAAILMLLQRICTDNSRLLQAKARAKKLNKEAEKLPEDCARRKTMEALAKPVQWRIFKASLVPLGILLGPMTLTLLWLPSRVDPLSWNARPGTSVTLQAIVDSDLRKPLRLEVEKPLEINELFESEQTLPPIRETLEEQLALWREEMSKERSEEISDQNHLNGFILSEYRKEKISDLEAYLKKGIPDRQVGWIINTSENESGKWWATVNTGEHKLKVPVVLGNKNPPEMVEVFGESENPIKALNITYARQTTQPAFWKPFAFAGFDWDAGWLWTYLLTYLPAMFFFRWILRIP